MKIKRLLSLLTAFAIFVSGLTVAYSAEVKFSDVPETSIYYEAVYSLSSFGLINGYPDGTFKPYDGITRAEFTAIVVRALGLDKLQTLSASTVFNDVVPGYWAEYVIYMAYANGIVNGFDAVTFKPSDNVTFEQAVKMVVCMLGYEQEALDKTGWPDGYMYVGSELGLTKGIVADQKSAATRGVIAQLVYNCLEVDILEKAKNAAGTYNYYFSDPPKTILTDKLKVEKKKVIVTAVEETSLDASVGSLPKNRMQVETVGKNPQAFIVNFDGVLASAEEARALLGHTINLFYKTEEDDDESLLVSYDSISAKNAEYNVMYSDIVDYKKSNLTFNTDGKKDAVTISIDPDNVRVVYNDKAVSQKEVDDISQALTKWLDPDSDDFIYGQVRIMDNGSDGTADVIFIKNYDVMVLGKVPSSNDYKFVDKHNPSDNVLELDPQNTSYSFTITKNGTNITDPLSVGVNSVLMYAKSLDESVIDVIVSTKTVKGEISETSMEHGNKTAYIADNKYIISQKYLDYAKGKEEVDVGSEATFYLDSYNVVAHVELTPLKEGIYAYCINTTGNANLEVYRLNLYRYNLSPKVSAVTLASKVKVNGSNVSSSKVEDALKKTAIYSNKDYESRSQVYESNASSAKITGISQLIKYTVNSSGEIDSIITLTDDADEESSNVNENISKLQLYNGLNYLKYSATNNFDNKFFTNSSTVYLYIPKNRTNTSEYVKITPSTFFKTGESYWVEPYDVNSSKIAKFVLVYGESTASKVNKDTNMAIVARTPSQVYYGGQNVNKVEMYQNSKTVVTKHTANSSSFADLQAGDIIKFGYNNFGRIVNQMDIIMMSDVADVLEGSARFDWTNKKFDIVYSENKEPVIDAESGMPYSRILVSNVHSIDTEDNIIRVSRSPFNDNNEIVEGIEQFDILSGVTVLKFDVKSETFTSGTLSDIQDSLTYGINASKVLMEVIKGRVNYILIYENYKASE